MKKNFLENNDLYQSIMSIDDMKKRIDKVEKKNDSLTAIFIATVLLAITATCAYFMFKKNSYNFDLFDDEYFEDDFEDFDDEFDDVFED